MNSTKTKSVSFGTITVTDFPIELGDNPACSKGAPIQMGWTAYESHTHNLEIYDFCRQSERKSRRKLIMTFERRNQLLIKAGYTMEEVMDAAMEAAAIQKSRRESLEGQGWERFVTVLESTGKLPRGIMRGVLGTTGEILSTTGGLIASTGRTVKKIVSTKQKVVPARSA